MTPSALATALAGVQTSLSAAATDIAGVVPEVITAALGIALLGFGARWVIRLFKGTAK